MSEDRFLIRLNLPQRVEGRRDKLDRDSFFDWCWTHLQGFGLCGIHEGTWLSDQGPLDVAQPPQSRDLVADEQILETLLYFETTRGAHEAARILTDEFSPKLSVGGPFTQKAQDWDEEWKKSFTGIFVPPFWKILPPHRNTDFTPGQRPLIINPGAGFGTGTHETTQLCLEALSAHADAKTVLDFGSGSGVLSITAALLGARVTAVEIDPLANDNARENAALNGVEDKIKFQADLPRGKKFDLIIANILKEVLIPFADQLCPLLQSGGTLILSGLLEKDLPEVIPCYRKHMKSEPRIKPLGEWRAVIWGWNS